MCSRNFFTKIWGSGGISSLIKNSPGILREIPYSISAAVAFMSSLKLVWSPRSIVDIYRDCNLTLKITIGVYHLKQASSYTREHMSDELYVHQEELDILRVKLQSRHTSSKQYQLWIRYEKDSFDPIRGWYCQCKNGARTVGCCAHIASVL
ncbi:hypothetical protein ABEB36_008388 [Hypothenemus hampei]|uniref:SWIM-type domain-containing protein n=1 Tax=Hypothenemus hampei TaxID=57062 RepID=A0ABD1ELN9_HYPHA